MPELEGAPSEEVVTPTDTPSETPTDTPAGDTPQEPQTPTEQLFDLPDGRKATAEQVKEEYENLLKDYTQKSQKLAAIERASNPNINNPEVPEWKRPDYVPKTYAEIIEIAEQRALEKLEQRALEEDTQAKEIVTMVDSQLAEIKKTDPKVDENQLFLHANRYGFRDLKQAHANMSAIKQAALDAEQRTLKNIKARGDTPIAGAPGVTVSDGSIDATVVNKYGSALEYFRALQGK